MSPNAQKGITASLVAIFAITAMGLALGIGAYTFIYAKGYSYLSNDPTACMNCHIMREQFDSWAKSSHHTVAVCNSCHTPSSSFIAKYLTKAENGFWHSLAFTTGRFHDPIQIKKRNMKVAERECMNCHRGLFERNPIPVHMEAEKGKGLSCVRCHGSVGHR